MSASKPTILLIPGAWHRGETWKPVLDLLEARSYHVMALTLPSAGGPVSSTVDDDAEYIRKNYLEELVSRGREVIVVMHSYSGVPGTESIKGLARKDLMEQGKPGGVIALVYITAYLISAGQSLASTIPSYCPNLLQPVPDNRHATQPANPRFHFYNDLDDEMATRCVDALVHHAMPCFLSPLTYEAYRDIPSTYLICERDEAILPPFQKTMIATAGDSIMRTYSCEAGHSPMISAPEKVADVIDDTAILARIDYEMRG